MLDLNSQEKKNLNSNISKLSFNNGTEMHGTLWTGEF